MRYCIQPIAYVVLIFGILLLTSCGASTPKPKRETPAGATPYHWRAQVLENSTITLVKMTLDERMVYEEGDSVWVDLATHRINDTLDNTMLCRLITCRRTD